MGLLDIILGKKRKVTRSEAHKCGLPQGVMVRVRERQDSRGKPIKTIRYRGRVHGREVH